MKLLNMLVFVDHAINNLKKEYPYNLQ